MSHIKEELHVQGATVPFYKYHEGDYEVIEFDSSSCVPPEPMVNAMIALQMLKAGMKLRMINHRSPAGLYPKIQEYFQIHESQMENGKVLVEIIFQKSKSEFADLNDKSCKG